MNNEPDMILATIECPNEKVSIDMELPANIPVGNMADKILEVLKNMYAGLFSSWTKCFLIYNNRILNNNETMLSAGIYDGGYIYVAKL